jgi:hypothetical protein
MAGNLTQIRPVWIGDLETGPKTSIIFFRCRQQRLNFLTPSPTALKNVKQSRRQRYKVQNGDFQA